MLTNEELRLVYERALIPEHLPSYVEAVSSGEPYLQDDCLCFARRKHLIFIGYPLGTETGNPSQSFESACERFRPTTVSVITPRLWFRDATYKTQSRDSYYKLDLPLETIPPELAYMIRRASREVAVGEGTFGRAHRKLINEFISGHGLSEEYRQIYKRIPHYLERSKTARLLEARRENTLIAFAIADLGSARYAFYLFNIRSTNEHVPGASDMLFYEMVKLSQSEGKTAINLGLGIHPGVRRFKEKWGGTPFLPYCSAFIRRDPLEMDGLVNKL
ncbi:MAG TPA: hypothetical protein VMW89_05570 [Desulfatiglandales bacterium]|nr:hypothetical protein [Desulfatiglandales bacterium]